MFLFSNSPSFTGVCEACNETKTASFWVQEIHFVVKLTHRVHLWWHHAVGYRQRRARHRCLYEQSVWWGAITHPLSRSFLISLSKYNWRRWVWRMPWRRACMSRAYGAVYINRLYAYIYIYIYIILRVKQLEVPYTVRLLCWQDIMFAE